MHPTKMLLFLSGVVLVFFVAMDVGAFGDESFQRQQSQANEGFDDLDKEFAEPESAKPSAPKVIIKEKIIVIEKHVPVPAPTPEPFVVTPAPVPKPSTRGRRVVSHGYRFDFQSCTLSNRNIECDIMVRTPEHDKTLILYSSHNFSRIRSSIFDNIGNQYHPRSTSLGNKESRQFIKARLIQGITAKIKVFFENVSSETSSIALLELEAEDNHKRFKVQFRNIPLSG
ncbi:hypothetical protein MNBD_NITROSPIRAE01-732 [hydrothermal vent metagenome]|uniref:Uncharacterized protein n=1 Tax=hydrothermal vent metagenome TaxID=652676 RepID=A0A3B1D6B8_9ZZZZ